MNSDTQPTATPAILGIMLNLIIFALEKLINIQIHNHSALRNATKNVCVQPKPWIKLIVITDALHPNLIISRYIADNGLVSANLVQHINNVSLDLFRMPKASPNTPRTKPARETRRRN